MKNIDDLKEKIEKYVPYNIQEEKDKEVIIECIDKYEDVLSRKNKICHFTASAWIVNKERTKVLMVHHNIYNSWSWVGGHADGDSDLLQVALKEVKEETGLKKIDLVTDTIFGIAILTVEGHVKKEEYVSSHLHFDCCYLIEADEEAEVRVKEDENSAVQWIQIDEVLQKSKEEKMKPIYKKLIDKLSKFYVN